MLRPISTTPTVPCDIIPSLSPAISLTMLTGARRRNRPYRRLGSRYRPRRTSPNNRLLRQISSPLGNFHESSITVQQYQRPQTIRHRNQPHRKVLPQPVSKPGTGNPSSLFSCLCVICLVGRGWLMISGSYVMPYVLADQNNWLEQGKDPFDFKVLNTFENMINSVR